MRPGIQAHFAPSGLVAEVRSLERHHEMVEEAYPGDNVGFNVKNISVKELRRGMVASDVNDHPASGVSSFEAQIIVMNHPGQIAKGYTPIVDCHTAHVACMITDIKQKMDRRTGEVLETNPEYVVAGDACIVTMQPRKPLCVESFTDFPPLGRFAIRDMKQTVAVGVIKSVTKDESVNR
jgi:elongation factor 1-alpha